MIEPYKLSINILYNCWKYIIIITITDETAAGYIYYPNIYTVTKINKYIRNIDI